MCYFILFSETYKMNVIIGDSRVLNIKRSCSFVMLREVEDVWGTPGGIYCMYVCMYIIYFRHMRHTFQQNRNIQITINKTSQPTRAYK